MALSGQIFDELGRRLGLGPLLFSPPEPLILDIAGVGILSFEKNSEADGDLLICLARPLPPHDRLTLLRALALCALTENSPIQLYCGCRKDHLLLMTRQPAAGLTAPELERLIDFLLKTDRKLTAG